MAKVNPQDQDKKCETCHHGLCRNCFHCHNSECTYGDKYPSHKCYDTISPSPKEGDNKMAIVEENAKKWFNESISSVSSAEDKFGEFFKWYYNKFRNLRDEQDAVPAIDIYDFFLSHRKAEYTSLIEEVKKMKNRDFDMSWDNRTVDAYKIALSDIIKLLQEKL
jgi:hypothetical protein